MQNDPKLFHPDFSDEPYWWEQARPERGDGDDVPAQVDVAVVGSGYAGMSAALELGRNGVNVVVLEKESLGYGAASRNGGAVSGGHNLGRSIGGDGGAGIAKGRKKAQLDEGRQAFDLVEELVEREKIDCDYERTGRFVGAYARSHYQGFLDKLDEINEGAKVDAYVVPEEQQREEITSDYYFGGMVVQRSGSIHPAKYHQGLVAAARRQGVKLCANAEVQKIERESGGYRITTRRGEVHAENIIIATNGYTQPVTQNLRRRIVPVASHIIATEPLPDDLARSLIPKNRTINDTARVLCYYRMCPDGKRMLFGGRPRFTQVDPVITATALHRSMVARFPDLEGYRVTHAWNGNVAFSFDHLPHIGQDDGMHYCIACNGAGISVMTYLGYRVARRVVAPAETEPSAFEQIPLRTKPLYTGNPWFLPVVGGYYRFRDRLDRRFT